MRTDLSRRVLVLFHHPDPNRIRSSIRQHLEMLSAGDVSHDVWYCNSHESVPASLKRIPFDAIILHTTFLCMRWSHLFSEFKWRLRWLSDLDCLKIAMPQDEYDHAEVLDEWLYELGVNVIFSTFDEPQRRQLYPLMRDRARFYKVLTGYIDEAAAAQMRPRLRPIANRRVDIVYRATHLPYWFGSHGQLKHGLGVAVASRARSRRMKIDISTREEDTIVGSRWLDFLASGKCVIGCESGSSVLDRRGEIRAKIQKMLRDEPSLSFDEVSRQLEPGWDEHRFFAISPRHFEAVTTRTCQILVEGAYDGILSADRHYIPLRRDLSNLDEVLDRCADPSELERIAECAYEEVYLSRRNTYRELAAQTTELLVERPARRTLFIPAAARLAGARQAAVDPSRPISRPPAEPRPNAPRSPGLVRWSVGYPSRFRITLKLFRRDPALLRLYLAYLRNRAVRKEVAPVRVVEDILVLAIIRQAQAGDLTAGEQFRVDLFLDRRSGRLAIVSRRPGEPAGPAAEQLLSQRLVARVTGIVFDHSAIGTSIHHLITTHRWLNIAIPGGKLRLEALARVVKRCPDAGMGALNMPAGSRRVARRNWSAQASHTAKGLSALYLGLTDRSLRRLVAFWLADSRARERVPARAFARDLLCLGLLRRAHGGRPSAGPTFQVVVDVRRSGIRLTSRHPNGQLPAVPSRPDAIKSIVWNHAAIGESIDYRSYRRKASRFELPGGHHRFEGLTSLAEMRPDLVAEAVLNLPRPRRRWSRIWVNPMNYVRKGSAAVSAAVTDPALRRLVLRLIRTNAERDRILEDVLKLSLARAESGFCVSTSRDGDMLTLRSCRSAEGVARLTTEQARILLTSKSFAGIVWDHSAVGATLRARSLGADLIVYLPDHGRHRFDTLARVARTDPELILDAISPLLGVSLPDSSQRLLENAVAPATTNA